MGNSDEREKGNLVHLPSSIILTTQSFMKQDVYFLKKTLDLAKKAEGFTSPNPLVGAVIVKNNKIVSFGYHKKAGKAHAEIEAFRKAKGKLNGATLYVNLEPCCHFGKTPPCVDKIIKSGIKRVVTATKDPNPLVSGDSIRRMRKSGISVSIGLLEKEAVRLNEVFFENMKKKMPFVVAKTAQSLDGKIATANGLSKWITNRNSRLFAKRLRDKYDSILVGVNTVIKDNPHLDGIKKVPYKVVIDPGLRIPLNSYLIKSSPEKLIIFASCSAKNKTVAKNTNVYFLKEKNGKLPLKELLSTLYRRGITSVFIEGGSETIGNFFDEKLVDKIYFFIAPKIIGGRKALTSIGAQGFLSLNCCPSIENMSIERIGTDILITGYPYYGKK